MKDFKRPKECERAFSQVTFTSYCLQEILKEITEVMANKPNIEKDEDSKIVRVCSFQSNTDSHSI